MVEKFAINLVDQMLENKMIVEQQKEYYIYSLILQIERIITLGTILIISYVEDNLILTVLFLIFFLTLRARTGGFHCNTFEQCYIGTTLTYALIAVLADYGVHYWKFLLAILFLAIATVVAIGTVNHPNMYMNSLELEGSKKAARMLVVLQGKIIQNGVVDTDWFDETSIWYRDNPDNLKLFPETGWEKREVVLSTGEKVYKYVNIDL